MIAAIFLAACIAFETVEQTVFTLSGRDSKRTFLWLGIGISIHVLAVLSWFRLLTFIPLGVAIPMMGGSYVSVSLVSRLLFKEQIPLVRWVGILTIIVGLVLVGKSGLDL